ncbi:MAG: hypothetical protein RL757_3233 [Bacteroidota bacterium]|jgi:hypothetical protein
MLRFKLPFGYLWAVEKEIFQEKKPSAFSPWYFTAERTFVGIIDGNHLIEFARRQDNDDAAWMVVENGAVVKFVSGYYDYTDTDRNVITYKEYINFWEWLKSVIDDIAYIFDFIETKDENNSA